MSPTTIESRTKKKITDNIGAKKPAAIKLSIKIFSVNFLNRC